VSNSLHLVIFTLDEQSYALHLAAVERTVRMVEITPLPKAPEVVLGVITVQGRIVPVLDMRQRFRLPPREVRLSDHILIARTRHRPVAFIADAVSEVSEITEQEIVEPSTIHPGLEQVAGVTRLDDGIIFIHDLDGFLSRDEEKALDAAVAP